MVFSVEKNNKPILVLGSKPDANLPKVSPEVVVTAKSAVLQAQVYRDLYGAKIVSLVPWPELKDREYMLSALQKVNPDTLVVLGDNHGESLSYVKDVIGLKNTEVIIKTLRERNLNLITGVGLKKIPLIFTMLKIRGFKFLVTSALRDLILEKDYKWLSRSTGINAILYASKFFPKDKQIIVSGIGLTVGGHFDGKGSFTAKSAKSDKIFMSKWPKQARPRLITTDEVLSEVAEVPLWQGEYL